MQVLSKILRMGEGRIVKRLASLADQIDTLSDSYESLSDAELREETDRLKARHADGESLDDLMPEAFATVREAAVRTLGQKHYKVQLMGGAALHMGNIAEMKTGEGKTLVATLPSYLNALTGMGVHVVTVNDYLASYQSELMGRVHRFLGMTTGCIVTGQRPDERRQQYAADITYGTNNEFGFDYLRDNMAWSVAELVQREHHFAIVDEVDSILIDEARTPLIISGPATGDVNAWFADFARIVKRLNPEEDYEVDEKKRTIGVLEPGIAKVEDYLGIDNLYESLNTPLIGFLNNAIKAKELFKRDKDYIVTKGEVHIVDEHTGRVLPGRRYNEGMHQAIEAKEGVQIKAENQTFATITLQNYFRMYDKLSGMTGTAETEAKEFVETYKVGVVPIPTNKDLARIDQGDLIYKGVKEKYAAIVEDIAERHAAGQPVLVGTTSVEKSETVSGLLTKKGVPHTVLNAKQHEREAHVVALAGRKGAVTVATNMAGRGTDIMLGGNAEHLAVQRLKDRGLDPVENAEEYEAAWDETFAQVKAEVKAEHEEVVELGGLYVLGSERHESRRIDNQLRGRSGRQGDPGESRFYLSMEDDLLRLFNAGLARRVMDGDSYPDDMPLEHSFVSKGIASAQSQIEQRNFEIRKNVLKYDDVMNRQRTVIYAQRQRVLHGEDLTDQVRGFLASVVGDLVAVHTSDGPPESWNLKALWAELGGIFPLSITIEDVQEEAGNATRVTQDMLVRELTSDANLAYDARTEAVGGEEAMRQLERRVVLSVLDRLWREHLYEMDYLKEGIGLRAMAQRDPLVEYQREGYDLFLAMNEAIKEDSVRLLFNLKVPGTEGAEGAAGAGGPGSTAGAGQGAPVVSAAGAAATAVSAGRVGAARGAGAGAAGVAGGASAGAGAPDEEPDLLGLEAPARPTSLTYSASAEGGEPEVRRAAADGTALAGGTGAPVGGQNRAQRRANKRT